MCNNIPANSPPGASRIRCMPGGPEQAKFVSATKPTGSDQLSYSLPQPREGQVQSLIAMAGKVFLKTQPFIRIGGPPSTPKYSAPGNQAAKDKLAEELVQQAMETGWKKISAVPSTAVKLGEVEMVAPDDQRIQGQVKIAGDQIYFQSKTGANYQLKGSRPTQQ